MTDDSGCPDIEIRPEFEITPAEADRRMREVPGFVLIDCREAHELEIAAVKGAVHIPLDQLMSPMFEPDWEPDTPVGVICRSGKRSLKAAIMFQQRGFDQARSVAGGVNLWAVTIDKTLTQY